MNRRDFLKMAAVGVLLFNIGGVAFGQGRARQIAKGAASDARLEATYRKGWELEC